MSVERSGGSPRERIWYALDPAGFLLPPDTARPERGADRPVAVEPVEERDWGYAAGIGIATCLGFARLIDITDSGPGMYLLFFLISGIGAYAAFFQPRWFPAVLAAYFPFNMLYPFVMGLGVNMTNVLLLLAPIAVASHRVQERQRHRFGAFEYLLFAFMGLGFLSFLQSYNLSRELGLGSALIGFKRWLTPIVFFFVIRALIRDRSDIARLLQVMAWTTFLAGLLTWKDGIDNGNRSSIEASRVSGIFNGPNEMGTFLVYASMPMLAAALFRARAWTRAFDLVAFLTCARAMLYTFSRGAYVSIAVGSSLILLLRNPLYLIGLAVAGAGAVAVHPGLIPDSVLVRLGHTTEESIYEGVSTERLDESVSHRFVLWKAAFGVVRDHPLSGVGLNRFHLYVDAYSDRPLGRNEPRDAHNAYLLIATEMGLPGLVVMIAFLATLYGATVRLYWRRTHPFDRTVTIGALGAFTAILCIFMLGSRFSDENFIGYFWILASSVMVLKHLPEPRRAVVSERAPVLVPSGGETR